MDELLVLVLVLAKHSSARVYTHHFVQPNVIEHGDEIAAQRATEAGVAFHLTVSVHQR